MITFILTAILAIVALLITWQIRGARRLHSAYIDTLVHSKVQAQQENIVLAQKAELANEHNRLQPNYRIIGTEIVKLQVVLLEMLNSNANK
jgi:hypothetical protein